MKNRLPLPLWILLGILLSAASSRAQDETPRRHFPNRFLFVLDTASDMKARTNGIEEAVVGLLASDMNGELRKGDTIGLWTYSDRLDTEFPMQVWSDKKKNDIINDLRVYVEGLHYGKRSHFEKVMPEIAQVASHSERLTIILIFDSDGVIKGTHFDKDINALHKQYDKEFKAAHQPLVTVMAVRDGSFFDYTINYPGTIVIPHTADPLPPPPPPPVTNPPVVVQAPPPRPQPERPRKQIILIGSNSTHKVVAPLVVTNAPPPPAVVVVANTPPPPVVAAIPAAPPAAPPVVEHTNAPPPEVAAAPPPAPPVATEPPPPAAKIAAPVVTPAPPPAEATVVVPAPASSSQQVAIFIIAFSLLTIAVVLVIFLVRRSKNGSQQSLISQSIDRSSR